MKKILTILLCFALFAGILTACNGKDEPAEEPEEQEEIPAEQGRARNMEFKEISAQQLLSEMGAGWNLGNTLDGGDSQQGRTPWQQETAWGNPQTSAAMIDLLVDTGFRSMRIPTTWGGFIGEAPDYEIAEVWLDRVQDVVNLAIDRDLYAVLNIHHEMWYYPLYCMCEPKCDEDASCTKNFDQNTEQLIAVWRQIATRFADYSERLILETLNEPRMRGHSSEWRSGTAESREIINYWNAVLVETIRGTGGHNDKRWIMVPPIIASSHQQAIDDFVLPDSNNLIVSIHAYLPFSFALDMNSDHNEFDPENLNHTQDIDNMFVRLEERFLSQGYAVIIDEMGAINKDNLEDRVRWVSYYAGKAAERGIPCFWWDPGIRDKVRPRDEAFGLMDRSGRGNNHQPTWWFPEIAEALVAAFE